MGAFDRIKIILDKAYPFFDHSRDDLYKVLQSYGVEAQKAVRGRIDIASGPIRWIKVLKRYVFSFEDPPPNTHWYVYGVPDSRLRSIFPVVHLKTFSVKKSWFREEIAISFKGDDSGLGIIERLNHNGSIAAAIFSSRCEVMDTQLKIEADNCHVCWTITTNVLPTRELWDCFHLIAEQLLTAPLGYGQIEK
jgi:hypothetical protein